MSTKKCETKNWVVQFLVHCCKKYHKNLIKPPVYISGVDAVTFSPVRSVFCIEKTYNF